MSQFQGSGIVRACSLTDWLNGTINGMEPLLMLLFTPVLFLLWQVKMSAVKRVHYFYWNSNKVLLWVLMWLKECRRPLWKKRQKTRQGSFCLWVWILAIKIKKLQHILKIIKKLKNKIKINRQILLYKVSVKLNIWVASSCTKICNSHIYIYYLWKTFTHITQDCMVYVMNTVYSLVWV